MDRVGVNKTKISPHRESPGIATLSYGGARQVSRIFHLLYDEATVYLPRKLDAVRPYILAKADAVKPKARRERAHDYRIAWREAVPHIPYGFCWCGCGQKTNLVEHTDTKKGYVEGEPARYLPHHFQRSLHESQEADVCRRYQAGESSEALAKAFGVSSHCVLGVLERNGVKRRASVAGDPLTSEEEAELCRRYSSGEKPKALAESFGKSTSGILSILERNGVPRLFWKPISPEHEDEICRRYRAGEELATIANDAGIRLTTIYSVLKRNGIQPNRNRSH